MKAAKNILVRYFGRKRITFASFALVFLFVLSTLSVALLTTAKATAAETCRFSGTVGGAEKTEGDVTKSTVIGDQLCIGPAYGATSSSGSSFFEFVVKFNGPVENANINFKNDDGNTGNLSGNFRKVNGTTYVVEPRDKAGYRLPYNFQSSQRCDANSDKRAGITVSVNANSKQQEFKFNLCDGANYNRDYSITRTADQIPADGQQPGGGGGNTGKGRLVGEFTTIRAGAPADSPARNGRSNKRCVIDIQVTNANGDVVQKGDANAPWYTLSNGVLEIPNMDPGTYSVGINYNDRLCMQQDNPGSQPAWTSDRLFVLATNLLVKAGEDTRFTLVNTVDAPGPVAEDQPVCTTGNGLAGAIAWILCPIASLIANATAFIERNLILPYLTVSPFTTDADNPVYLLWQSVRNVANLAFIIAFFMVIFSQATSIGLSNYGIKRLLPRIALVAVLTNLSYFVAAFLIDTFNIFGAGAGQMVMEALKQAKVGEQNYDPSAGQFWFLGGAALAAILVKAGPVLGWLFGLIGMAFLIILVAIIVLVIRQMLIILLVVLSPLAFVAWLLPNTERYFSKWFDLFTKLLMMYPFIVLLFASGKIFGALLGNPNYNLGGLDTGESSDLAEVIRVVMQFLANCIPLALLPFGLMAGGALMRRISNGARRIAGRVGQGALGAARNSSIGQFASQKLNDLRTKRKGTPPPTSGLRAWTPGNVKRRVGQGIRSSTLFNRATGGFGTYLDRENASARREMNERAEKFLGNDLNSAFALESAKGDGNKLRQIIKRGYWDDARPGESQINTDTKQRLQQFLNAGNYKGAAAARAAGGVLAATNQLNRERYANLAEIAGQDGSQARDEYIAEQNVTNDKAGFSNLAQAGYVNGRFEQYATAYGNKSAQAVFSGMRLGDTKKQVFKDETIRAQLQQVRMQGPQSNQYREAVRESLRMKPDQLQEFVTGMSADLSPSQAQTFKAAFALHQDAMRDEIARGRTSGGPTPPPTPPPPSPGTP